MKKQLLFLACALTSTHMHAMNSDILDNITLHLCKSHEYRTLFRKDVKSFARVNNDSYEYYKSEKNQQRIIEYWARRENLSTSYAITDLHLPAIEKKFKRFFEIAQNKNKQFTQEDLEKDYWYLNTSDICREPVLRYALRYKQFDKAQTILKYARALDCFGTSRRSSLGYITYLRDEEKNNQAQRDILLNLARETLTKMDNPDEEDGINSLTALMYAVGYHDEKMIRLLLEHDANPHHQVKSRISHLNYTLITAFDCCKNEEKKQWLQNIIDDVALRKSITQQILATPNEEIDDLVTSLNILTLPVHIQAMIYSLIAQKLGFLK